MHVNHRPMKPVLLKHSEELFLVNVTFSQTKFGMKQIPEFYLFLFCLPTFLVYSISHQFRILKTFIYVIEPKIRSENSL